MKRKILLALVILTVNALLNITFAANVSFSDILNCGIVGAICGFMFIINSIIR